MLTTGFLASILLAGLVGSVHCVAMCGPFAAAAGRRGTAALALYTAGRLSAYLALGTLAGALGSGLLAALGGLSVAASALAILAGLGLVALGLLSLLPPRGGRARGLGPLGPLYTRLIPLVRACVSAHRRDEAYLLGVLNGLLPCPVTSPLLLVALASGSAASGGALLLALGLGTLPAMLAAGRAGGGVLAWLDRRADGARPAWLARAPGLAILALGLITAARPFIPAGLAGHLH
jgi:hypothetical protein